MLGLSQNIRAIVSQRLIPTIDNRRCAAVEVLLGTKTIQELILKSRLDEIKEIMEKSESLGMQTFDAALFKLYMGEVITLDEALANADSPNNLRLRIKLARESDSEDEASSSADGEAPTASAFGELSLEEIKQPDEEETEESCGGLVDFIERKAQQTNQPAS